MELTMDKKKLLKPFSCIGNIEFGMSQEEVAKILGKPDEIEDDDIMEEIREKRDNIEYLYTYEDEKKLGEITFFNGSSLFFNDVDLMNTSGILEKLQSEYSDFEDIKGHCNFLSLGIVLCGFGKKKMPEGKYVIAYGETRKSFYEGYGSH